jgi:hypothetical protein
LFGADARLGWIEPDLAPLRWQPDDLVHAVTDAQGVGS